MKSACLCLLCKLVFFSSLLGQPISEKTDTNKNYLLQIVELDQTNNHLFEKNSKLLSLKVTYRDGAPYSAFVYTEDMGKSLTKSEFYDLTFQGDAFVFKKTYGSIYHMSFPKLNILPDIGKENIDRGYVFNHALFRKDTVTYIFKRQSSSENSTEPDLRHFFPARFKGDMKLREDRLAREFSEMSHQIDIDSIVVFSATVDKLGYLSGMELIAGKGSAFSKLVKNSFDSPPDELGLQRPIADWIATTTDSGMRLTRKIKIYARLNKDGSVTIRTPRKLGTLSGE